MAWSGSSANHSSSLTPICSRGAANVDRTLRGREYGGAERAATSNIGRILQMGQDKLDRDSVYRIGDDDVEGHRMGKPAAGGDEDVEGHRMGKPAAGGDEDVEGHRMGKPA